MNSIIRLDSVAEETLRSRVLVVDDDPIIRDVVVNYLEAQGFDAVKTAPSGPDAALMAESFDPEVVLLDYLMPALKGDDTAIVLRKVVPRATIIAFSAVLNERPAWADAFLPKSRLHEAAPLIEAVRSAVVETQN